MNQKNIIGVLVVVIIVLGAAVMFMAGQKSVTPELPTPDANQNQEEPIDSSETDNTLDNEPAAIEDEEPQEPVLGKKGDSCKADADCEGALYCAKTGGDACVTTSIGSCEPKPVVCTMIYSPVCGCDGKTYSNSCAAAGAGVNISSQGSCSQT